jgi:hypothetical protein
MTSPACETGTRLTLVDEIQRYLVVVEAFAALGAQPTWIREAPMVEVNAKPSPSDHLDGLRIPSSGRGDG